MDTYLTPLQARILKVLPAKRFIRTLYVSQEVGASVIDTARALRSLHEQRLISKRIDSTWRRIVYRCRRCGETDPEKFIRSWGLITYSLCTECWEIEARERREKKKN